MTEFHAPTTEAIADPRAGAPGDETRIVHLSAGGTSLVVDGTGDRLPRILHWGQGLGSPTAADLANLARASVPPVVSNSIDHPLPFGVIAEPSTGWAGSPGIEGSRVGRSFTPLFTVTRMVTRTAGDAGGVVTVSALDEAAGLALDLDISLSPAGIVRLSVTLTNTGDDDYGVD